MSAQWDRDDLAAIAAADELRISSRRRDGTLSRPVTIWSVALHGVVVVRSAYGAENGWYRRALARGAGRISAAGIERDVRFQPGDHFDQALIDEEYRRKYAHYADAVVRTVAGEQVHGLSLIVTPAR
jgi:hypothetical protein